MGSVLNNADAKKKFQIFTPEEVVKDMLDAVGYMHNLKGKKILENSCGGGNFLSEIVSRYISDAKKNNCSTDEIKAGLENDIWGADIDIEKIEECIFRLNTIAENCGIFNVKWRIYCRDYLRKPFDIKFDYIVANPPYISYWNIPKTEQKYLHEHFATCAEGLFDYCFAFVELGISSLSDEGRLVYIIPSSIFKTKAAQTLRAQIRPHLVSIIDYKTRKVFPDATTASAILLAEKKCTNDAVLYKNVSLGKEYAINRDNLDDNLWIFINERTETPCQRKEIRFGDCFDISSSIATQLNTAFVLYNWTEEGKYLISSNGDKVEKAVTKDAACPRRLKAGKKDRIIFPYIVVDGSVRRYEQKIFKKLYPETYNFLKMRKKDLKKRAADKNAKWYEYGRTQAIGDVEKDKIILSSVVSNCVQAWIVEAGTVPYSGFYITAREGFRLQRALEIIKSESFLEYVKEVGVHVNGDSIRVSVKNIADYSWVE